MTVDFIPHTKRRRMTKARAARIFLARNGICFNCRKQIRGGEKWFIEHPDALAQGGSDDDSNLWPSHVKTCKAKKDAADAGTKAKRDRLITASWEPEGERPRSKLQSRGFAPAKPQHSATTPHRKQLGRFEETP